MKKFLYFLALGAAFALFCLWNSSAATADSFEEIQEQCKTSGDCVMVPKSFLVRLHQAMEAAQDTINAQDKKIQEIRGRLNKSCA